MNGWIRLALALVVFTAFFAAPLARAHLAGIAFAAEPGNRVVPLSPRDFYWRKFRATLRRCPLLWATTFLALQGIGRYIWRSSWLGFPQVGTNPSCWEYYSIALKVLCPLNVILAGLGISLLFSAGLFPVGGRVKRFLIPLLLPLSLLSYAYLAVATKRILPRAVSVRLKPVQTGQQPKVTGVVFDPLRLVDPAWNSYSPSNDPADNLADRFQPAVWGGLRSVFSVLFKPTFELFEPALLAETAADSKGPRPHYFGPWAGPPPGGVVAYWSPIALWPLYNLVPCFLIALLCQRWARRQGERWFRFEG